MWTDLRTSIDKSRKELNLSNKDFSEVNLNNWKEIEQKINKNFLIKNNESKVWKWEYFKEPLHIISFNSDPYKNLNKIIKSTEIVYFIINETVNGKTKFWYYEGTIDSIQNIIGESVGIDEYYITSKKFDWILCFNHHNNLIGSGEIIVKKLREFEKTATNTA